MLRFQKVLAEQKKKLKGYSSRRWQFIEEEKHSVGTFEHHSSIILYSFAKDEDENEAAQLLENDIEFGKLEVPYLITFDSTNTTAYTRPTKILYMRDTSVSQRSIRTCTLQTSCIRTWRS